MENESSPYYQSAAKLSIAAQIGYKARLKMFNLFTDFTKSFTDPYILDVGVTSDQKTGSNFLEKWYQDKNRIVCAGVENGAFLEQQYPGIKFQPIQANERLPFADHSFDVVFSSAVIEHVGSFDQQVFFISELLRVSNYFFITTPNRWFPVEVHTAVPILHWLPKKIYRSIYNLLGLNFWAQEENLNLLDTTGFLRLFPENAQVKTTHISTYGFKSNIIAFGKSNNK